MSRWAFARTRAISFSVKELSLEGLVSGFCQTQYTKGFRRVKSFDFADGNLPAFFAAVKVKEGEFEFHCFIQIF